MLNFKFKIRPFLLFQLFQKPDAAVGLVLMAMRVLSWSSSRVVVGVALGNGAPPWNFRFQGRNISPVKDKRVQCVAPKRVSYENCKAHE
jgi:hypothetical protein